MHAHIHLTTSSTLTLLFSFFFGHYLFNLNASVFFWTLHDNRTNKAFPAHITFTDRYVTLSVFTNSNQARPHRDVKVM